MPNSTLIKFANDTTVIGLIISDDESDYCNEIKPLVNWSNDDNLTMIVDFRKSRHWKYSVIINGSAVEQVNIHKFLGLTVMNTLSWTQNADKNKKWKTKVVVFIRYLFLLLTVVLRSHNANNDVMISFYRSVIESILTTNMLVRFGCTNKRDIKEIDHQQNC